MNAVATEAQRGASLWITLAAMTLAASMILVDQTAVPLATPHAIEELNANIDDSQWLLTANIVPLAAFLVLGGKLGDLIGLRRVFLAGAAVFVVATILAGAAQDLGWMLGARVLQGLGAACMMPTAVAIVSAVAPAASRGMALGVLAGGSAFFAALGPVLGGLLTSIDWRLVFYVNVPLAAIAIILTLRGTPAIPPQGGGRIRDLDFPGVIALATFAAGLVFGLSQVLDAGFFQPEVLIPLAVSLLALACFVVVELRSAAPLMDLRLFRHRNFLAANISQLLAGAVELGMGFLLPFVLLIVIGVDPLAAGVALIPATVPIILAGPLAGKAFDRIGGRLPLTIGFLILAASGVALAVGVGAESVLALVPGLILQGVALGIVLTVNDPVGLNAVPEKDRGTAAGMINTSEQLGGALGIAVLLAVELGYYRERLLSDLAELGVTPTSRDLDAGKEFISQVTEEGLRNVTPPPELAPVVGLIVDTHVAGFQAAFVVGSGLALLGALACFVLTRREQQAAAEPVFSRRSRWHFMTSGRSPAITKHPPGTERA